MIRIKHLPVMIFIFTLLSGVWWIHHAEAQTSEQLTAAYEATHCGSNQIACPDKTVTIPIDCTQNGQPGRKTCTFNIQYSKDPVCGNCVSCQAEQLDCAAQCIIDTPTPTIPPDEVPTVPAVPTSVPTSAPPSAVPTAISASPTPRGPTRIITRALNNSSSQEFNAFYTQSAPSLRQVCLLTKDCSDPLSNCTVKSDHRVQLSTDDTHKALKNAETYIAECISTSTASICTTGNKNHDNELFGSYDGTRSNLEYLQSSLGYRRDVFASVINGRTSTASNPIMSDGNGMLGTYEWDSRTKDQLERAFFAINNLDKLSYLSIGDQKTVKQSTFTFEVTETSQNCTVIAWDPSGIIYDANSKQLLEKAEVTLFQKKGSNFEKVETKEILGNFRNPYVTGKNGYYAFQVPDGIYILKVKKPGYKEYTSDVIKQKNAPVLLNVALHK